MPRHSDLSFYNWDTQTETCTSTANYQVDPGTHLCAPQLADCHAAWQLLRHKHLTQASLSCSHVGADGGCQRPFVQEQARPQNHRSRSNGVLLCSTCHCPFICFPFPPPSACAESGGSATSLFQPTLILISPTTDAGGVTRRQLHAHRAADKRLPPSRFLRPRHPISPLNLKGVLRCN